MNIPDAHSKAAVVEAMLDRIAAHYDLMNRLITFGMDRIRRRQAVQALAASRYIQQLAVEMSARSLPSVTTQLAHLAIKQDSTHLGKLCTG